MARVFIDPGHGGKDSGAVYGYHQEADYNLAISFFLDYELRLAGISTELSREEDTTVSLAERVRRAKAFSAEAFVSIHCDAWHRETAKGFSTHVYENGKLNLLGRFIHDSLARHLSGHRDRGLRESNFYVLRKTPMPAALVECEFISNPETAAFLKQPANQRMIARAVASGVIRYLRHKEENHA